MAVTDIVGIRLDAYDAYDAWRTWDPDDSLFQHLLASDRVDL